jgi:serine/threonine-protein kinase
MINKLRPGFQFNQYNLLEQIGVGGQGVVWSAEDLQKQDVVAIKFNEVPVTGQEQVDDAQLEEQLRKIVLLRHPHVLSIHDYGMIDRVRYLVSPYVAGGSLYEKINNTPMQLADTLRYVSEIASALGFLHQNQIIHRDLKPANVLLDLHQDTYLSDFGLARSVSSTTQAMHTGRGTPPYAPPEQHKQLAITIKSDIFSFGVMLYELFTGQLPWNGDKILGMQQLYSKVEMPDPCEVNADLPPQLKDVLRRMTSADPALRPSTVREVAKMIDYIFNANGTLIPELQTPLNDELILSRDVPVLLKQKIAGWDSKKKGTLVNPTQLAMVHLYQKRKNSVEGPLAQFLLYHSVLYDYHDEYWWQKTSDPRDRAVAFLALLEGRNEVVAGRVMAYLFKDRSTISFMRSKAPALSTLLLELAFKTKNPTLATQLLSGVQLITPPNHAWNDSTLPVEQGMLLGRAALVDNEAGDHAVQLIAHFHSKSAVEFILKNAARTQLPGILLKLQEASGSLPSSVGSHIKTQVFFEWANQQITTQPTRLAAGYATALIGSTLGIASQIYLTYRLPDFLDLTRISSSLIQGLITGFVFGLGIFLSRLIMERFKKASFFVRFSFASLIGALVMSAALFLFHLLFLNTMPAGWLIPLGCFVIACSYSVGGLIPWRFVKMMLTMASVVAAIVGTWLIHVNFSAAITDLTPLFQYDATWSLIQISFTAFCVSLGVGVLGNIPPMDIQDE